jgi:CheY-like chemotaxis protein
MATVLIVKDEAAIRDSLRRLLEEEGYTVLEAANGAEGLRTLQAHPEPLMVLFDHRMPHQDGEAWLRQVMEDDLAHAPHLYAEMTAGPHLLSAEFRVWLAAHDVPIITLPLDVDLFIATVATLAQRLGSK